MLSCIFCIISKNTFFTEHLWATASARIICGYFVYNMIASARELWPWQLANLILGNIGTPAIERFQFYVFSQNINNMKHSSWLLTGFNIKSNVTLKNTTHFLFSTLMFPIANKQKQANKKISWWCEKCWQ